MRKKGQTEIIGLAIIVLLVVVGMTFIIRFMLAKDPVDFKKQFTQAELSSNIINTFLKSTSRDCNGLSMTELIKDCGLSKTIFCENGKISCEYTKETAQFIFGETLEKWNLDYEFKIFQEEEDPMVILGSKCLGSKKSKLFPIPTAYNTLFVKLDICG
jgi:hypothetical protein